MEQNYSLTAINGRKGKISFVLSVVLILVAFSLTALGQASSQSVITLPAMQDNVVTMQAGGLLNISVTNTGYNQVYRVQRTYPADPTSLTVTAYGGTLVFPAIRMDYAGVQILTLFGPQENGFIHSFKVEVQGNNTYADGSMPNLFPSAEGESGPPDDVETVEYIPVLSGEFAYLCTGASQTIKIHNSQSGLVYFLMQTFPPAGSTLVQATGNGGTIRLNSHPTVNNAIWTVYAANETFTAQSYTTVIDPNITAFIHNLTQNTDYCNTIQYAIDQADAGNVINVDPGIYVEQVLIQKNLTLVGDGIGQTIIRAPATASNCVAGITGVGTNWQSDYLLAAYPTDWNGAAATGTPIQVKVTDLTLDANYTMHDCGRYTGAFFGCVKGANYADAGLFNCNVINFNASDASATGVRILGDSKLSVADCDNIEYTINGIAAYGDLSTAADPDVFLDDNTMICAVSSLAGTEYALNICFGATGTVNDNTVTDAAIDGILISSSSGVTVTGNTIANQANGIVLYHANGNFIGTAGTGNGNTISACSSNGIYLDASGNNIILANSISNIHSGNTSTPGACGWGIGLDQYSGICSGNAIGDGTCANANDITTCDAGIIFYGSGTGNTAKGNKIHGNSPHGLNNTGGAVVDATLNWWGTATGPTVASNPCGTGDPLTNETNVSYEPWYNNATCDAQVYKLTAAITAQSNVNCNGGATGSVTVTAQYGTSPYQYTIDNWATYNTTGIFTGLTAGNYTVVVRDASLCTVSVPVTITQLPVLYATVTTTDQTACTGGGTINISGATGGSGTYEYSIATPESWGSSGSFTGVAPGTYAVKMRDELNQPCVLDLGSKTILNLPVKNVTDEPDTYYPTIQAAIDAASDGEVIEVCDGIYKEQPIITKGLTIIGNVANPDNVVIDGENKTNLPSYGQVRIYNPTGAVDFKGFKIINTGIPTGGDLYLGIMARSSYLVTIQNCKLIGHGESLEPGWDYGLWAYGSTGPLVFTNNYMTEFYHGILLERQWGATTISNNTFDAFFTGMVGTDGPYGGRVIEAIIYGTTDVTSPQRVTSNNFINIKSTGVLFSGGFSGQTPRKFTDVEIDNNNFDFIATDIVNPYGAINLRNVSTGNSDPAGGVTANIHNNLIDVPSVNSINITGLNGTILCNQNSIADNGYYGMEASLSLGPIDATCNWWGSSDYTTIQSNITGPVTFMPYLMDGTDASTDIGFQPVEPNPCALGAVAITAVPDHIICGESLGSITVTITGGTSPYNISWTGPSSGSGTNVSSPYLIPALAAGTYTITVYATGSQATTTVSVDYLPVTNVTNDPDTYYPTIQAAIDAETTVNGDVIEICAGLYKENVVVTKQLTLKGLSRTETIIAPTAEDTGDGWSKTAGTPQNGIKIQSNNVTIQTLTVDGTANNLENGGTLPNHFNFRHGILLGDGVDYTGITVQDCDVKNILRRAVYLYPTLGYTGQYAVTGCNVLNVRYQNAISIGSPNSTISGNTLDNVNNAISVHHGGNGAPVYTTTITNNVITNLGHIRESETYPPTGIYYRNPNNDRGVIIQNNSITAANNVAAVIGFYLYNMDNNSIVSGNTVNLATQTSIDPTIPVGGTYDGFAWSYPLGAYLGGSAGATIQNNNFSLYGTGSGIYTGRGSGSTPVPNIITDNTLTATSPSGTGFESYGIASSDDPAFDVIEENQYNSNNTITFNDITGFRRGILLHDVNTYSVSATIHDNNISGNTLYGVDASTIPETIDASANWWGNATGPYRTPDNLCGLGNEVTSTNVTICNWYTNVAMTPAYLNGCITNAPVITGDNSVCANSSATYDNSTHIEGNTITWEVSGGTITGTSENSVTVQWGGGPSGWLKVTETNPATTCVMTSAQFDVTINANPTVTVNSPVICASEESVTITATPSPAGTYTYVWTVPAGASDPGNIASFTATVAGTYSVIITDGNTCTGTGSGTLTINANPTVTVNSPTVCASELPVTITATPSPTGEYSYAWTVPAGALDPGNVASFPATVAGTYSVVITDGNTCTGSGSGTLTVLPLPTATITGTQSVCYGGSATLSIALTGTAPWSLTYTNGTTPVTVTGISTSPYTFTVYPTGNMVYTVTNVTDATGCSNTGTGSAGIYIGPVTTAATVTNACAGDVVNVPVTVTGFADVGAISLTLNYDPAVLSFVSYTQAAGLMSDFIVTNNVIAGVGVIKAAGTAIPPALPVTLDDGTALFTLTFTYNGTVSPTALTWNDSPDPAMCEYAAFAPDYLPFCDVPTNAYYIDGSVSHVPAPVISATVTGPVSSIPMTSGNSYAMSICSGQQVTTSDVTSTSIDPSACGPLWVRVTYNTTISTLPPTETYNAPVSAVVPTSITPENHDGIAKDITFVSTPFYDKDGSGTLTAGDPVGAPVTFVLTVQPTPDISATVTGPAGSVPMTSGGNYAMTICSGQLVTTSDVTSTSVDPSACGPLWVEVTYTTTISTLPPTLTINTPVAPVLPPTPITPENHDGIAKDITFVSTPYYEVDGIPGRTAGDVTGLPITFVLTVNPQPDVTNGTAITCSGVPLNIDLQAQVLDLTNCDFTWTVADNPDVTGESAGSGDYITQTLINTSTTAQTVVYTVTPYSPLGCPGATFTMTVTVNPYPMISFGFNGEEAGHNAEFTYCYPTVLTVDVHAIYAGVAPFTVTYTLDGGTPVTVSNLELNDVIANQTLAVGTHTITVTDIVDANGCHASAQFLGYCVATIYINPQPLVTDVSLLTSTDQTNWTGVSGTLAGGYEMCIDPVIPFHYLDIDALTAGPNSLLTTSFNQNAFYLDETQVPAGFWTYWANQGVVSGASGWQGVMWQIINGNSPMFYVNYNGTDYQLIDGLQYQTGSGTNPLRISGDYPQGAYHFSGTVTDVNGCASVPFPVTIEFNSSPVVTAVTLLTSTDQSTWTAVSGDLDNGYEMCIDPVIPFHYLDINTMTVGVNSLLTTSFAQNAFYLDETTVPSGFFAYWAAKGVVSGASGWQGVMWNIINGTAPMFYVNYTGSDYQLIDGLQYQTGSGTNPLRISGDYPQGLYKFSGTVTDVNGCVSSFFDVFLQLNSSPVVTEVSLLTSTDLDGWTSVSGDLATGYTMCIDPVIPYHYLDISTLSGPVNPLLSPVFTQNAFYLDETDVPAGFFEYWAAKGVVSGASGWQGMMWNIINGNAPMFYIKYNDEDYTLIDGLQWQFGAVESTLRISGDYPQGDYTFGGTVTDVNGCVSSFFDVMIHFNSSPVVEDAVLLSSIDQSTWTELNGDLETGYALCIDPEIEFYYLDVSTLSGPVNPLASATFVQNAFRLNTTSVPVGFYEYWDAKGVNSSALPGTWQYTMYQIIMGLQPMFYLSYDGAGNYALIDGMQYQFSEGTVTAPLRVSGDYPQGDYTFYGSVLDINGCFSSFFDVYIEFNTIPALSVQTTDVTCFGGSDGIIDLTVAGQGPFTFLWSNTATTEDLSGLPIGTYTVTVTDSKGCLNTISATISQPEILSAYVSSTNVTCNGTNDGTITVSNPQGGHGTYQVSINDYNWYSVSGSVPYTFTGLADGFYSVLIRDAGYPLCVIELIPNLSITEPDPLYATVTSTNVTCNGADNGTITVSNPYGGYGYYDVSIGVSWEPLATGSSYTFTGLAPASYNVSIRDAAHTGCVMPLGTQVITQPAVLSATVTVTQPSCNTTNDGQITVSDPTGGYGTWQVSINGANWFTVTTIAPYTFGNLAPGTYTVYIRDAGNTGCIITLGTSYTITAPPAVSLTGAFNYYNNALTPLKHVTVELWQGGSWLYQVATGEGNTYSFPNVCPGTYEVRISTTVSTGGINSTDAALVNAYSVSDPNWPVIQKVKFYAGDVVSPDYLLLPADAQRILQYFVTSGIPTWSPRGPWTIWQPGTTSTNPTPGTLYPTVTVTAGAGTMTQNFYALCTGDYNQSFTPSTSKSFHPTLELKYAQTRQALPGETIELPVVAASAMDVTAISMIMNFPSDKLEIEEIYLSGDPDNPLMFAVNGDEVRIGWQSKDAMKVNAGDRLFTMVVRLGSALTEGESLKFSLTGSDLNELADASFAVIDGAVLFIDVIEAATGIDVVQVSDKMMLANYPNPFDGKTTFTYTLPEEGPVTLDLYTLMGTKVKSLVNEIQKAGGHSVTFDGAVLPSGVYLVVLKLDGQRGEYESIIKIVRNK